MRTISTSQFKNKVRQAQHKAERQIRQIQRETERKLKSEVNKVVNQYNRDLRKNQQKIRNEFNKLNSNVRISSSYSSSVRLLNSYYHNVSLTYDSLSHKTNNQQRIYDLIEQENSNNLVVANALENVVDGVDDDINLNTSSIGDKLKLISQDLNDRWTGALFSLNPQNPDATRHFCTSSREIFTDIFDEYALDEDVFNMFPNCEKTDRGNATRRWKIKYFLNKKGIVLDGADQFIETDIENILELYHILSDGTHGTAGRYSILQLKAIKKRVEDGILFLCNLII